MGKSNKKKVKRCPKCGESTPKGSVYCEQCGVNIRDYLVKNPPEPRISTGTAVWVILALIFVFPIGVIGLIWAYYDLNKRKDRWQRERLINQMETQP